MDVDVGWNGDKKVVVRYMTAKRVAKHQPAVRLGDKQVAVELRVGVENPKASGGSMWRNRQLAGNHMPES